MKIRPEREKTSEELHDEVVREVIWEASKSSSIDKDEPYPWARTLMLAIGALFLVMLFVFWALPDSAIKLDPEPKNIPRLAEFISAETQLPASLNSTRPNGRYIQSFVMPTEPIVKEVATKIAVQSCNSRTEAVDVCRAKALFYFVQENFAYVSETDDYYQTPVEMFYSKGGDCDDFSIMLASMEQAIGIPTRLVMVPGHVFVQVYLEEAHKKYKQEDGWINVDATCSSCAFGEAPGKYKDVPKQFLWLN